MIVEGSTNRALVKKGAKLRERIERLTEALKHNDLFKELEEARTKLAEVEAEVVSLVAEIAPKDSRVDLTIPGDERAASIQFRLDYQVDTEKALKLKKVLGEDWEQVFSEHLKVNRARSYSTWMAREGHEDIKNRVRSCVTETRGKPAVSWRYGIETVGK